MNLEELPKKIQYINVNSNYVDGTINTFSINFNFTSNIFVEEMRDVIGIKVVDFYAMQVGTNGAGTGNEPKLIDIICQDVPTPGQILDERKPQILARIPLESQFDGSNGFLKWDKHWENWNRKTNYFNPISIKKLSFEIFELQGDGDYSLLKPDYNYYFTLEITTIDRKAPPKDTNLRVVKAINKLCAKVDELNDNIQKMPPPPEPKKKIPLRNDLFFLLLISGGIFFVSKQKNNVE